MSERYVIKRSGQKSILDISHIHKQTKAPCERNGVSQSDLEAEVSKVLRDEITTVEIQLALERAARDKISIEEPNWTFVASEVLLTGIYHSVGKKYKSKKTKYGHTLEEYLDKGLEYNRIIIGLKETYAEHLDELNSYLEPDRDLQFTYLGAKTLSDRYLLRDNNKEIIELPQHMFMAIAMMLAFQEKPEVRLEWVKKFYDMISKFEVMMATPTLSNARRPRSQMSSCYVGSTPDNIEGIFDSFSEMALLSKYGGGIGWDWTWVRSIGSEIDGHKGASGGVIPFNKITNDVAIAVDQTGVRKGSIAPYLQPWHIDIVDFIDLKKNSGEERRRAHDLFPALWINDLFMERVVSDSDWTLFDPYETPQLVDAFGEDFKAHYERCEKDRSLNKRTMRAKALWKQILTSYFESGSPFLCFKDEANKRNPNNHTGVISSSNLCTEIYQNTAPGKYETVVEFVDGNKRTYGELDLVVTDSGHTKQSTRLTPIDSVNGVQVLHAQKLQIEGSAKVATCNLASVNLSKVNTKEDFERVIPIAVRALDNVVSLNFFPTRNTKVTSDATRAIGLGMMGEAEMIARREITWGTTEHMNLIDRVCEDFSYQTISASMELSKVRGAYPDFKGSKWHKGELPIDSANKDALALLKRDVLNDWDKLRADVSTFGIRNGYLMAIAPTSSISILTGTTQAIEPVFKRMWYEENLSGLIPTVAPGLNAATWKHYIPAYDLDQKILIRAAAIRQKWIDQGQSLNIFIKVENMTAREISELYILAWTLGLKATYYLRSESPETANDIEDRTMECVGCQ